MHESQWVVAGAARFCSFYACMLMVVGADPGAKGLMEALVGGTDHPPLLQEVGAGLVGHAVATAVNSAR